MTGRGGERDKLRKLAEGSEILNLLLALETGEHVSDASRAFSQLAKGELAQAIATAQPELITSRLILEFAAASEGASRETIEKVLQLPFLREPSNTMWSTLALFEREGRPHEELDAVVRRANKDADKLLPFAKLDYLKKGRPVETALSNMPVDKQAIACTMALVRSAAHAPKSCRELVKAYYFASERPYFR
jgi:hypothetical protein